MKSSSDGAGRRHIQFPRFGVMLRHIVFTLIISSIGWAQAEPTPSPVVTMMTIGRDTNIGFGSPDLVRANAEYDTRTSIAGMQRMTGKKKTMRRQGRTKNKVSSSSNSKMSVNKRTSSARKGMRKMSRGKRGKKPNFETQEDVQQRALESVSGFERPINRFAINAPLTALIDDKLYYGFYQNQGASSTTSTIAKEHLVPDFSYAGYEGGGVALPTYQSMSVRRTLTPSGGDDYAAIQQALDEVAALATNANAFDSSSSRGIKGVVLLTKGRYMISQTLMMASSGVILRGEGQGPEDTVLVSTNNEMKGTIIRVTGKSTGDSPKMQALMLSSEEALPIRPMATSLSGTAVRVTDILIPTGSRKVTVASTAGFNVGDMVALVRTPNDVWVSAAEGIGMAQFGWDAKDYEASYEAKIVEVDEQQRQLVLDVPLVETIEARYGGAEIYRTDNSNRIQQTGIENIRLTVLEGGAPDDYNRAYQGIHMMFVENSWIRDVTFVGVSHGVKVSSGALFITIQDSAYREPSFEVIGGNHYGFNLESGQGILVQRCLVSEGRHPYVTGAVVRGPNVYLDSVSVLDTNDTGPHHRWSTGTLYDNLSGWQLNIQNRGSSGTGHGWTGAQQMLWNVDYDQIILQAPRGAMNWAVGAKGTFVEGRWITDEPNGIIESQSQTVQPRSLYLQQIRDRLGDSAVNAITVPLQRQGSIRDQLESWDGNSRSPVSASTLS